MISNIEQQVAYIPTLINHRHIEMDSSQASTEATSNTTLICTKTTSTAPQNSDEATMSSSQASNEVTNSMPSHGSMNARNLSEKSTLEVGDLVKISERSERGKPRRDAGTGRVIQVSAIPVEKLLPGEHPFLYDVKYIVGGKLSSLHRSDLTYTTPYHEFASVRKHPPTTAIDIMKENRENKSNRISGEKNRPGTRFTEEKYPNISSTLSSNILQTDLYERHKKEMEKLLLKLENTDRRGLFDTDGNEENNCLQESGEQRSTVPISWMDIRKRVFSDVYVLDRLSIFSKSNKKLMHPYHHWKQSMGISVTTPFSKMEIRFPRGVDWEHFRNDVAGMCTAIKLRSIDTADFDTIQNTISKIMLVANDAIPRLAQRQESEMRLIENKHRFTEVLQSSNNKEPAIQRTWRKIPYPERLYQRLATSNVLCDGLLPVDQRIAICELETSLSDRFVGQSYTYDDNRQSEWWMKSIISRKSARKSKRRSNDEDRVAAYMQEDSRMVKAQVRTCVEKLLISVTDRVMTEMGVLQKPEVRSVNWLDGDARKLKHSSHISLLMEDEIHITNAGYEHSESSSSSTLLPEVIEQPVWGIDCYTRKNIEACIEADFDSLVATDFIEKWLLPAINACPAEFAYDMSRAAKILEGFSPIESGTESNITDDPHQSLILNALKEKLLVASPPWLKPVAHQLRTAVESIGGHAFCVHPKGHGSVVICSEGIPANTLVTHYRGEVYPPWRWGEKLDAIEETQRMFKLKKNLPDFYNFCLERPQNDPRGYGILFVDASRKAGLGSSFSHSCNPTCEVKVVAINGQLSLAITTLRKVDVGEELTFDYNGVTESLDEYHAAICLCGHRICRGSFLHFATADCYQEVMRQDFPLAARFAALCKSCNKRNLTDDDKERLLAHGFKTACFGPVSVSFQVPKLFGDRSSNKPIESLDNVPVWLQTFAAETLKYIEYERRRLPIALVLKSLSERERILSLGSVSETAKRKRLSLFDDCTFLKSINLEDADAEGWLTMEQRIHQLVQTLSRVGRVLSRYRESLFKTHMFSSSANVKNIFDLHHPVAIVPDHKVVEYLWSDERGIWQSAKNYIDYDAIRDDFKYIDTKYSILYNVHSQLAEARSTLSSALLEMRERILLRLSVIRRSTSSALEKTKKRNDGRTAPKCFHLFERDSEETSILDKNTIDRLEAASDMLLLYAKTANFFEIKPYISLSSSPIDVYARELGDVTTQIPSGLNKSESKAACVSSNYKVESLSDYQPILSSSSAVSSYPENSNGTQYEPLLNPDQVIASLTVEYKEDYVLSLLLQWFTGGMSLSPCLPDMFGCIDLPSIRHLWENTTDDSQDSYCSQGYANEIRPLILSYIEDIQKRGDAWPDEVKKFFLRNRRFENNKFVGSPTLDFYITGEDSTLSQIVHALKTVGRMDLVGEEATNETSSKSEPVSLMSELSSEPVSFAVSTNWVQCENPSCMKWRKLPWHVNLDDLPEKFFCNNNIWNPKLRSCDDPEDSWDYLDAPLPTGNNNIPETAFVKGARFDVQRKGKRLFTEAVVIATDMLEQDKRVMFHFLRASKELDEWLPIRSSRIAPHKSYVR